YRFLPSQSDDIDVPFDPPTDPFGSTARPLGPAGRRPINRPNPGLVTLAPPDAATFAAVRRPPMVPPPTANPPGGKRNDADPSSVSTAWDQGVLQQTFASGTGRRINRYTLSPDGRLLTMRVTVDGGGLPGALAYTLVYQRVA